MTGGEVICGAATTLAVKGLMIMETTVGHYPQTLRNMSLTSIYRTCAVATAHISFYHQGTHVVGGNALFKTLFTEHATHYNVYSSLCQYCQRQNAAIDVYYLVDKPVIGCASVA